MKKLISVVGIGAIALGLVLAVSPGAVAAPNRPDKVTICHRTHSVTNPYRMITVSQSSVNGPLNPSDDPANNDADHAGHLHNGYERSSGSYVRKYPGNPNVFTPGFSYWGPSKVWEDIIPPFTANSTRGTLRAGDNYQGFNWSTDGRAIYFGAGNVGGQPAFGLCKKMTAKEFYESEVTALRELDSEDPDISLTDREITNEISDDLKEQGAEEDAGLDLNDPENLPDQPSRPLGPPPPDGLVDLTQAIGGRVWYDDNHNGLQDNNEQDAVDVEVVLEDPYGDVGAQTPIAAGNLSGLRMQTAGFMPLATGGVITTRTGQYGSFFFTSVPAGQWQVRVVTPTNYKYTYDSVGSSDGLAPTLVPVGGAGYMWAGLITADSSWSSPFGDGSNPSSMSSLAETGLRSNPGNVWLAVVLVVTGALTVLTTRRMERRGLGVRRTPRHRR